MESALVSLILSTLMLFAILTLSESYFTTQDALLMAAQVREAQIEERLHTALALVSAETKSSGSVVELTFKNSGSTKLADFTEWDLMLHYYTVTNTYQLQWYPYVAGGNPGASQWSVVGLYTDTASAAAEVYEPKLLNPGEELLIRVKLASPVRPHTALFVTVATPNGVALSASFSD